MASHVERLMSAFAAEFHSTVRGFWRMEFHLHSSPFLEWNMKDVSAVHLYDINGDFFSAVIVPRQDIIINPENAGKEAAKKLIKNN